MEFGQELNPGGMLSPDVTSLLDEDRGSQPSANHVRERRYEQEPDYGEVDGDAFGYVFDVQVVADGGRGRGYMSDVEHTPPEWTDMDNPSL